MRPETRAAGELRRLVRDGQADLAVLASLTGEVAKMGLRPAPLGPEAEAFLAVKIHAWYTALETLLERIARVIEGSVPGGPSSHQDLLRGMALPLPDVRPAVLSKDRLSDLAELLSFRHFFRHAYAIDLDEPQLRNHAKRVVRVHPGVQGDLEAFHEVVMSWAIAAET